MGGRGLGLRETGLHSLSGFQLPEQMSSKSVGRDSSLFMTEQGVVKGSSNVDDAFPVPVSPRAVWFCLPGWLSWLLIASIE